jgi:hypothetical protein
MTTSTTTPANEILSQLGGRQFLAMTGSKNVFSTNNGMTLSMHLTKNAAKAKYLQITLNNNDTYTMIFTKTVGKKYEEEIVEVAKVENIYGDMLQPIFTNVTGLLTKL